MCALFEDKSHFRRFEDLLGPERASGEELQGLRVLEYPQGKAICVQLQGDVARLLTFGNRHGAD